MKFQMRSKGKEMQRRKEAEGKNSKKKGLWKVREKKSQKAKSVFVG